MKIFLTGATGFVGAHAARALAAAGHRLRLLVRNAEAATAYFTACGMPIEAHGAVELVVADMCNERAVRQGMAGCDAVVHAAASVSLSMGMAQLTYDNNMCGIRSVLGSAIALGVRNLVYVSSASVLFAPGLARIDEHTPLAPATDPYSRSKRDGEQYVRALQQQGAAVQIVYPCAVIGPDDPKLSKANYGVRHFAAMATPNTSSGFQCVDVRDLAQAIRFLVEHPPAADFEPARFIVGGHYYPWPQLRELIEGLTQRRMFSPPIPGALLRALGSLVDQLTLLVPFDTTLTAEAMAYVTQWAPADSGRFLRHSGQQFRPGVETFADTLHWLVRAGHLHPKRLAPAGASCA